MIKKRPVAHIGVAVSEVDKNAQWYQDILGFQIKAKFVGRTGHNVYFLEGANNAIYEMYQDDNLDPAVAGKIDILHMIHKIFMQIINFAWMQDTILLLMV
ncbi:MAG: VOC family protein [Eubacteriales bacterium]